MVRFRTFTWFEYGNGEGEKKGRARWGWKEGEENGESGESEKASNQTTMYRHRGRGLFSVVDVVRHRQAILIRGVPDV